MPALSYKKRFVAAVAAGEKPHSIRAWRRRPFKVGDVLYHYTAMRTKACAKIRPDTICTAVYAIEVNPGHRYVILGRARLTDAQVEGLAKKDGFANTAEFYQFFTEEHGGIVCGQLVEWNPFASSPASARENGEPAAGADRAPLFPVRSSPAAAGKQEPRGQRRKASAAAASPRAAK